MREKIRAKSLYQLFEVIQFLKLLNPIVRGQFSLGQTLQVIALGQKHTSPVGGGAGCSCCCCCSLHCTYYYPTSLAPHWERTPPLLPAAHRPMKTCSSSPAQALPCSPLRPPASRVSVNRSPLTPTACPCHPGPKRAPLQPTGHCRRSSTPRTPAAE